MIQSRAVQSQAEAHRGALAASAARPVARTRSATRARPAARTRPGPAWTADSGRRRVAPRLGAWLIAFGTRLGGASVRTS